MKKRSWIGILKPVEWINFNPIDPDFKMEMGTRHTAGWRPLSLSDPLLLPAGRPGHRIQTGDSTMLYIPSHDRMMVVFPCTVSIPVKMTTPFSGRRDWRSNILTKVKAGME